MLYFYRFEGKGLTVRGSGLRTIPTSCGSLVMYSGGRCVFPCELVLVDCTSDFDGHPARRSLIDEIPTKSVDLSTLPDGTILRAEIPTRDGRETIWFSRNNTAIVQLDKEGNDIIAASMSPDKFHVSGVTRVIDRKDLKRYDEYPYVVGFLTWGEVYERLK